MWLCGEDREQEKPAFFFPLSARLWPEGQYAFPSVSISAFELCVELLPPSMWKMDRYVKAISSVLILTLILVLILARRAAPPIRPCSSWNPTLLDGAETVSLAKIERAANMQAQETSQYTVRSSMNLFLRNQACRTLYKRRGGLVRRLNKQRSFWWFIICPMAALIGVYYWPEFGLDWFICDIRRSTCFKSLMHGAVSYRLQVDLSRDRVGTCSITRYSSRRRSEEAGGLKTLSGV